jgi:trigger factor
VSVKYERLPEVPEVDFKPRSTLEKPVAEVEDKAAIEEALENLAKSANTFDDRADGAAEDGDQVMIDFVGSIDGEEFEGGKPPRTIRWCSARGASSRASRSSSRASRPATRRTVKVSFPEEYGAKHLAGKEASFAVTVKAVKSPNPAEIDDELAKRFGYGEPRRSQDQHPRAAAGQNTGRRPAQSSSAG